MNDEPVYDDLAIFLATCGLDAIPQEILDAEERAAGDGESPRG